MPQLLALDRYLPRPSFYSSYWDKFCSVIYHMVKVKKTWIFHIRLVWALSLLPANIKYMHFKLQNLCLLSFSGTCAPSSFSSLTPLYPAQKMKFSIKDFFSKCDQIRRFLVTLVTFTEEVLNGKLYFLCSVNYYVWYNVSASYGYV